MYHQLALVSITLIHLVSSTHSDLGHLKPFGTAGSLSDVEEIQDAYPEIFKFFTFYLPKAEPVLSRQVLNHDSHFHIWKTDEQLEMEVAGLSKTSVSVQTMHQPQPLQMNFGEFLDRYQKERLYLADTVPDVLR